MKILKPFTQYIAILALTIGLASPIGPIACKTRLSETGVYQGDVFLYQAEKTILTAHESFRAFLMWELNFRPVLPVEVSRTADVIRLNEKKWLDAVNAMRDTYVAQPSLVNKDRFQATLNLITSALAEASKFMVENKKEAPNSGLVKK